VFLAIQPTVRREGWSIRRSGLQRRFVPISLVGLPFVGRRVGGSGCLARRSRLAAEQPLWRNVIVLEPRSIDVKLRMNASP